MYDSTKYISNDLVRAIFEGSLTDETYYKAKEEAQQLKAQKEAQQKQAAEEHRQIQLEKQKFENRFPKTWQFKHVYMSDLTACCDESPLADMQKYLNEMMTGQHRAEFFKNSFFDALNFLNAKINERVNASTTNEHKKIELAKIKDNINRDTAELKATALKVQALHAETKELFKEIHPDPTQKTKSYTT